MKNDELYRRIKQQRKNKDSRDIVPYLNYLQKNRRSERLLKNVRRSIKDKASLKEALIQFIIADVTAFEVYFRDLFHASFTFCLDEREFFTKCEKLVDKKFDFQDLVIISYDQIELCDIIIEHQKFQNLSNLDKIFSTVIKENFFNSLNNREFEIKSSEHDKHPIIFKLEPNWYKNLDEYLRLRHNLTHDFNPKLKINPERIDELHGIMSDVIIAADIVFREEVFVPNVINRRGKRQQKQNQRKIK